MLAVCTHTWSSKDSDQLRRASTVVTDRNDIAERTLLAFSNFSKDVDEVVRCASAGEDHDTFRLCCHRGDMEEG